MDDFLTETWFIVLLGSILAIIIMSFGAMVFVKRKHMLMKQGALGKFLYTIFVFVYQTYFGNDEKLTYLMTAFREGVFIFCMH